MKIEAENNRSNIVIAISGLPGSGKSTVAEKLAEKLEMSKISGGDALKELAVEEGYEPSGEDWWETEAGRDFLDLRGEDDRFDKKVDDKLLEMAKEGDIILDSWTMPWLLSSGFKVWIKADKEVRAKRVAERDNISYDQAFESIKEREEKTFSIYKEIYDIEIGKDFSPFNIVISSNELTPEKIVNILSFSIDQKYS
ncbi:hypothetical protein AKJ41_05825 [candidate division MSBL1 archaeon SCGC-AAA259O05]|uniref:Uncharacterized protein n=1 Tax=candidate division MSBL1 archaeon SCGC-AAA259O05 TaxID=1698271 RepID=A0A133UYC1_9EURY|nr:hypothetical protein AKJ41_05825 [candidate division MSBL1 archaeon SCGC-AAA259O05]